MASTGSRTEPAVWGGAVIPALGRQRQEGHKFKVSLQGHSEFKDILDYVVSLRLSKRKRKKKKKNLGMERKLAEVMDSGPLNECEGLGE